MRSVGWAVVIGFVLRAVFAYPRIQEMVGNPFRDHWVFAYETGRIARSLALGQGFANPLYGPSGPTAWMGPVFPALIAAVLKIFGVFTRASAIVTLTLNCLISAVTALPIFLVARKAFGESVGRAAVWAWVFYPIALYASGNWVWETGLTGLLLATLLAITLRMENLRGWVGWAGYGILWGLAALTNPAALSVFPAMVVWAALRARSQGRKALPLAVASVLALGMTLAPWTLRNERVFHHLIPIRDNFGLELWVGNNGENSDPYPAWKAHPSGNDQELTEFYRLGEWDYMQKKQAQAIERLRQHPGEYALNVIRRVVLTWTGFWNGSSNRVVIIFMVLVTGLMALGLRRAFREKRAVAHLFGWVLLLFPVVYYLTHVLPRYRHAIDPEIVILSVYGAPLLWKR